MFLPVFSPELIEKTKDSDKKGHLKSEVDKIRFPKHAFFPSALIYLIIFLLYMYKNGAYSAITILVILALPFYYWEVKRLVNEFYEK